MRTIFVFIFGTTMRSKAPIMQGEVPGVITSDEQRRSRGFRPLFQQVLLIKNVNWQSSVSLIVVFFIAACHSIITQSNGAENIILSASGVETIMLSVHAESIILSVPPTESMMLSAHAEIIILSVLPAESMILSALPSDATHKHTGMVR